MTGIFQDDDKTIRRFRSKKKFWHRTRTHTNSFILEKIDKRRGYCIPIVGYYREPPVYYSLNPYSAVVGSGFVRLSAPNYRVSLVTNNYCSSRLCLSLTLDEPDEQILCLRSRTPIGNVPHTNGPRARFPCTHTKPGDCFLFVFILLIVLFSVRIKNSLTE